MAKSKKWYYVGWLDMKRFESCSTEKAFYVYYHTGHWGSGHDKVMWFPKSQCIFEEPNDVGNFRVYIPCWLIDNVPMADVHRLDFGSYEGRVQM